MLNQFVAYFSGSKVVVAFIAIVVILFIVAVIRYLFDRSGGYF